jgi:hypothetical protein
VPIKPKRTTSRTTSSKKAKSHSVAPSSTFRIEDLMVGILPPLAQCGKHGWKHNSHKKSGTQTCRAGVSKTVKHTAVECPLCEIVHPIDIATAAERRELKKLLKAALAALES